MGNVEDLFAGGKATDSQNEVIVVVLVIVLIVVLVFVLVRFQNATHST